MSKPKLSPRAQKVLDWIRKSCHPGVGQGPDAGLRQHDIMIRQQTLADLLGCSCRSIYRALKQLKEQGYLVETGKRQNRCKVYEVNLSCQRRLASSSTASSILDPSLRWDDKMGRDPGLRQGDKIPLNSPLPKGEEKPLSRLAKFHLDNCRNIFRYNFPESFDWEKHFPEATHKIRHVEHQTKFWRLMFDNLYLIQERETGKPHSARIDNPDSTLFGVPYPKAPPPNNIDHILKTRPAYR